MNHAAHPLPAAPLPAVAVVGAGFSGTMAALHLRRALPPGTPIHLLDATARFARGPAYAETPAPLLLNVRAGNMSAFPDQPAHFEHWLASHDPAESAGPYATRRLYGRYLQSLLSEELARPGNTIHLHADTATALEPRSGRWLLRCAGGRTLPVAAAVLATGNLLPPHQASPADFPDPWNPEATAALRPDEPVLVLGTGLTMVDLCLTMAERGFEGPVLAISRRGLVPQPHATTPQPPSPAPALPNPRSLTALLRTVRHAARGAPDWRTVIDGLRPVTTPLWQALPPSEQARFLRHLRPYWDSHRHRMAPAVAEAFAALRACGTVQVRRARLLAVHPHGTPAGPAARVDIQPHGTTTPETLHVQRLIRATGPGPAPKADPFTAQLVRSGLAQPDPQGLGLQVSDDLRVHPATAPLWALGPAVRGVFWECTSVPDIRRQAATLAAAVAEALHPQHQGQFP